MKCEFKGCKRYAWEDDKEGFCVFHSCLVEQKTEEFQQAWKLFLDKRLRDDGMYRHLNCSGFVFPGSLSLSKCILSEGANFKEARFSGDAHFEGVRFQGHAYFSYARFLGSARFDGARFDKIADFGGARFDRIAAFPEVRFGLSADFKRSHFSKGGHFEETAFEKSVDFRNAEGGPIAFEKAILDGADLRECSLSNLLLTNITRHRGATFGPTEVHNVDWTGSDLLRKKALHQNHLHDFRARNRFNRYVLYPLWKVTSNFIRLGRFGDTHPGLK